MATADIQMRMEDITMEKIGYDLMLAVVSAILGTLFGTLASKLLKDEKKATEIRVDKQLVFSQIHIEQKQYIINDSRKVRTNTKDTNKGESLNGTELIVVFLLVSILLVNWFLKHERLICGIVIFSFVFLEMAFLMTACIITKRCEVDKSIKSIVLFNILATICVPILIFFLRTPIFDPGFNKEGILKQVEAEGILSILFDIKVFGFLLYQVMGIIVLFVFMMFTLVGMIHVLSMVNVMLKNQFSRMWKWIYIKTVGFCKTVKFYISFGLVLLVLSFLFVSGVLWTLIIRI